MTLSHNTSLMMLGLAASQLLGCAGPTTPLGAVWSFGMPKRIEDFRDRMRAPASLASKARIEISPSRQVLHGFHPLIVKIDDPDGFQGPYRIVITYNDLDVSTTFLRQATTTHSRQGTRLTLKIPRVNLPAGWEHQIQVAYLGTSGAFAQSSYEPPRCMPFRDVPIRTTYDFNPSPHLLSTIDRVSKEKGFNPAFTAGLIAQESGFNPTTVSWARAIGLTQMTPIAEEEIASKISDWPRYPGLNEIAIPWLKGMIVAGEVNSQNEWRLNEDRSIRGGLTYAAYLFERWKSPENAALLKASFADPEAAIPKLVLASYNSGFTRVYNALARSKGEWLFSGEMRSVRKYVERIESYCDHFSEPENEDEKTS